MSANGMEAPYSIASIPRPIDGDNGHTYAAPVFGIRDSRKRKRHEVVVGVDGESVNIYNVQSQGMIATYALPPNTYLCCPPASVYVRAGADQTARRITYCAVKEGPNDQKRRLISFIEDLSRSSAGVAASKKKELQLRDIEVANLEVVPSATGSALAVFVSHSDGHIFGVHSDLSKTTDLGQPTHEGGEKFEVESAGTIASDVCRKGLLKNREDVLATLDQLGSSPALQWQVIRVGAVRHFQLLALNLAWLDGVQSLNRRPTVLMSYQLPSPSRSRSEAGYYELHASSGTLYGLVDGRLDVSDISKTIVKRVTRIGGRTAPVLSFSRLSGNSILAVGGGKATVYETKYASVRGSISLSTGSATSETRKRKHEEIDGELGRFNLVAWFAELGQAIGTCGSELMTLQLSPDLSSSTRRKGDGTTLADVVGKGTVKEARSLLKAEKRNEEWLAWTAEVTKLDEANRIEELESIIANDKTLGKQRKSNKLEDLDESEGMVYDDAAAYEDLWPLPEPLDPQNLDRNKIQYLLTKIFRFDEAGTGRPTVAIRSPKLIEWLALTGSLSIAFLRKAFQSIGHVQQADPDLRPGDIMAAVREMDDDFQLMHDLFHLPVHWDISEIVQALRMILDSFNVDPAAETQLALPALTKPNGDTQQPNGDVESEMEVAENELDHAVNALTAGLEVRSDALRAIFARLHTLNPLEVTSTMRAMMSQEELFFLIHILRIELADGGWTSRYIDIGRPEGTQQEGMVDALAGIEESGPSDESIKVIGFLLNCAVDAIGVSGWLVGLGGNGGAKDLVESLRAEVSAGYEGCLEANYVKAFLADIERYAAERAQLAFDDAPFDEEDGTVLPVGGKVMSSKMKGRNGKEDRKSRIAQAQEKSRRVGKYSFERIRI